MASKSASYLREREQEQIDAATKAALRNNTATAVAPVAAPTPVAPVIEYGIKHRFVQALRDCHGDAYRVPYALIEEAKAKLGDKEIDSEIFHHARVIEGVIIGCNASVDKLCRELLMVHWSRRLVELKAIKAAEEKQKIADAATAKAHSGRFVKRTP